MRGSPVLRFILLAIALTATAVGLQRITTARLVNPQAPDTLPGKSTNQDLSAIPFRLMLSAPAASVEIETGAVIHPDLSDMPISGMLEMDPGNPHVALVVRWKSPAMPGEHRFAKLTLEPPGQETWIHVFDSEGDIDDFLEFHFPVAK